MAKETVVDFYLNIWNTVQSLLSRKNWCLHQARKNWQQTSDNVVRTKQIFDNDDKNAFIAAEKFYVWNR